MSHASADNRRIAKNTFFLYIRMFIVTLINIYIVRVVLDVLGAENYGIYNIVAGVVTSLSFLTTVLSSSTQRFYSFYMGSGCEDRINNVFNVSLRCYLWLALIIILFGETIGLWFVSNKLSIPDSRMGAALFAYHFSILSFVFTILQIPFSSLMIAKEDMVIWSIITIVDSVLKLATALLLSYVVIDVLIAYAGSLCVIWLLSLLLYIIVCRIRYKSICKINNVQFDKKLFKEMLSYSSWSLFGSIAGVGINQGVTIIISIFFTPIVNAARAVSLQINGAISAFCTSFIMSVRPPIVKSYAAGDIGRTIQLFYFSNKFLYYGTIMVCLPLVLEMSYILQLWLKEVTAYMAIFSQYSVICAVILVLSNPITIVMQATGDIRAYHLIVETFTLLIMPIVYIVFKLGGSPESSYVVMMILFSIAHLLRILILSRKIQGITLGTYLTKFALPAIIITLVAFYVASYVQNLMVESFVRLVVIVLISVCTIAVSSFFIGMTKNERHYIVKMFLKKKIKGSI